MLLGPAGSNRLLFWAPRVLCILLIAFVSMFALDVFGEGLGIWGTLVALTIHLIPSLIMVALLALAWRWEWIGTAAFGLIGIFFAITVRGTWWVKLIFAAPCLLSAWLFLLNWLKRPRPAVAQ
jgi:hypothetical protein